MIHFSVPHKTGPYIKRLQLSLSGMYGLIRTQSSSVFIIDAQAAKVKKRIIVSRKLLSRLLYNDTLKIRGH